MLIVLWLLFNQIKLGNYLTVLFQWPGNVHKIILLIIFYIK